MKLKIIVFLIAICTLFALETNAQEVVYLKKW